MDDVITVTIVADVKRYSSIAERWPPKIVLVGTKAQIDHFMMHGIYEAGCDDLFVNEDATKCQ